MGGYPQIINFNRIFHCKPSISGYPPFVETLIYLLSAKIGEGHSYFTMSGGFSTK
jgi:hypothetical protein